MPVLSPLGGMPGGIALRKPSTEGIAVTVSTAHPTPEHIPGPDEPTVPELEADQTIAPRPEEEIADALRSQPDVADHSEHPA